MSSRKRRTRNSGTPRGSGLATAGMGYTRKLRRPRSVRMALKARKS
jgi:hypothetical protein